MRNFGFAIDVFCGRALMWFRDTCRCGPDAADMGQQAGAGGGRATCAQLAYCVGVLARGPRGGNDDVRRRDAVHVDSQRCELFHFSVRALALLLARPEITIHEHS